MISRVGSLWQDRVSCKDTTSQVEHDGEYESTLHQNRVVSVRPLYYSTTLVCRISSVDECPYVHLSVAKSHTVVGERLTESYRQGYRHGGSPVQLR